MSRSYNIRTVAVTIAGSAIFICAGLAYANSQQSAAVTSRAAVTSPPEPRPKGIERIVGPGRVEPLTGEVDVSSEFTGTLESVDVREGDVVTKGQPLAKLRSGNLKAKVAEATALLKSKTAAYERLKAGSRPEEIEQAKAALAEITHSVELLNDRFQRQKSLQSGGFATAALLKEARSLADQAAAKRNAAAAHLEMLVNGARKEDIDAALAEVEMAQALLDDAETNLDKSVVRAPFEGTVLRRYREPGTRVTDQGTTPIVQLGDLSALVVRTQIDEAEISAVRLGDRTEIRVPAYPGKTFSGRVIRLSPRLGAKTITTDAPTEKRDARVLDVIVQLDRGTMLPVGLRVDCFIITQ